MKKVKYGIAKFFEENINTTLTTGAFIIPAIAAVSTVSMLTDDAPQFDLDSFTNSDTAAKVEYLDREMHEINTDYIESRSNLNKINAMKLEQGADAVKELYIDHEQAVEEITTDFKQFEYDLFAMGISEKDMQTISVSFNDLPIASNYNLGVNQNNAVVVNDAIQGFDKEKYGYTEDLRGKFTEAVKKKVKSSMKDTRTSDFIILSMITFLPYFLIGLFSTIAFGNSNLRSRWLEDKPEDKKTLSPSNPNKSNKL